MILSEQTRRWAEIQFYYFCLDIYHLRHNMVDVILLIEVICQIAQLNFKSLKTIAAKMLGDPSYMPSRDEVIVLANLHGLKASEITRTTGISKSKVLYTINDKKDAYIPFPQFSIPEDQELYNFNKHFSEIKKASI